VDLTFREKSILGSLAFTIVLFTYYFSKVFQVITIGTSEALLGLPLLVIGVVIVLVIVEAVYYTAIALHKKPEDPDERDNVIQARATRVAYWVLISGSFLAVGHLMFGSFFQRAGIEDVLATPIMSANLVLFSVILAEITGFAMQLYYYRRGI
jgi:hypothetical protein